MKKIAFAFIIMICCMSSVGQELPRIAVYVTGGKNANENKMLSGQITHALVTSGQFRTIERADAFLDQVAREHTIQRSGAVDDRQIVRLGQQAGAQFVCIAEMVGAFGGYQISARIVNVENVEITHSGIANGELRTMSDFVALSNGVVATLLGTSSGAGHLSRGGGVGLSRGDRIEVVQTLERERVEITYTNNESQRIDVFDILPGTIFEVVSRPTEIGGIIEAVPVRWVTVEGWFMENATEIIRALLPERFWEIRRFNPNIGYSEVQGEIKEYSFSLRLDYLGTKVRKIE